MEEQLGIKLCFYRNGVLLLKEEDSVTSEDYWSGLKIEVVDG
jgi:hypothetical protein